uniref:Uncharacterized protein n=1 Tax=Hyalangium minutum TaxID=394096 RepID=A0A3Q8I1S0_9BACT|nr:hypothetical protein [Hyalangium minutum]
MNEKTAQESQKTESPKAETTPAKKAVIVKTRIKAGPGGGPVYPQAN